MEYVMMQLELRDLTQLNVQTRLSSLLLIPKQLLDSRKDSKHQVRSDVVLVLQRIHHTLGIP